MEVRGAHYPLCDPWYTTSMSFFGLYHGFYMLQFKSKLRDSRRNDQK